MNNDAAERLRSILRHAGFATFEVDDALAAERRATVKRMLPWLHHVDTCGWYVHQPCTCGLDEEAQR
jgi:hypothetical protein